MKRPEVTLDNYPAVYDFYDNYHPSRLASWALYGALGATFTPHVRYAEGVEEAIKQELDTGKNLVIVANHTKGIDPCEMASTLIREQTLRPLVGKTFIPAKSPIFYDLIKAPSALNILLRRSVDGLYSIPVFRSKEYGNNDPALAPAARRLLTTCVRKLDSGEHMAILGEGERNTGDPTKIQKIQSGVGLMVCRVSEVEQPALVTMGMYYGKNGSLGRSPTVYIGAVSQETFEKPREVINWLTPELQASVDAAVQYTTASR